MMVFRNSLIMLLFLLLLGCILKPTTPIKSTAPVKSNTIVDTTPVEPKPISKKRYKKPEVIAIPVYTEIDRLFMEFAKNGDYQEIKKLLEKEGVKINVKVKDAEGWTALHEASVSGHVEIAKLLIPFTGLITTIDQISSEKRCEPGKRSSGE